MMKLLCLIVVVCLAQHGQSQFCGCNAGQDCAYMQWGTACDTAQDCSNFHGEAECVNSTSWFTYGTCCTKLRCEDATKTPFRMCMSADPGSLDVICKQMDHPDAVCNVMPELVDQFVGACCD